MSKYLHAVSFEGYIARDRIGNIYAHTLEPKKLKLSGEWESWGYNFILHKNSFPDVTWDDEKARKVKITIEEIE